LEGSREGLHHWEEADSAKRYATKYLEKAIRKGYYKSDDVDYLDCAMEFDSMEGYDKVEDYVEWFGDSMHGNHGGREELRKRKLLEQN
jgi:hypothetical protein